MSRKYTVDLQGSVQYFKGVGPKRAEHLERLGVSTVQDLLEYYPRAWEDRKETPSPVPGQTPLVLKARVVNARAIHTRSRLAIFKATLNIPAWNDTVEAVWFKRMSHRYDVFDKLKEDLRPGTDLWVIARTGEESLVDVREIQVDEYYLLDDPHAGLHVGCLVPIYSLTEGIPQRFLRELVAKSLTFAAQVPDVPPPALVRKRSLLAASQALQGVHFPKSPAELKEARRRLAYEELLLLELAWTLKKRQTKEVPKNFGYEIKRHLLTPFKNHLEFEMTHAQKRVINEIFSDMQHAYPMTRLLQGDVGSGKTIVALAALLLAVENGHQGAFMAPTEILAEQHSWTFSKFLKDLPVKVHLLTSRVPAAKRKKILEELRSGEADIVIGTHALIEGDVEFSRLRLVVIDEQHRFGVRQRTTLRQKGPPMDLLVMTATPIPRTLALALFGDLDVSTLDEMPPGRAAVATRQGSESEALEQVRREAARGRQAYIVYPIISESSRVELKAAKMEFERLSSGALGGLRVALIHGQMPGRQKARIMEEFARHEWDVLVATPVIEVGIDAPNATIVVVQNADRFGLASLHQLRGRVGRGDHASQCWLVAEAKTDEAKRRLETMCSTSDGFKIGEEDLKLRGPGEILGTSQHGELALKVADLIKDADILAEARADAQEVLAEDAGLLRPENRILRDKLLAIYQRKWQTIDLA